MLRAKASLAEWIGKVKVPLLISDTAVLLDKNLAKIECEDFSLAI